MCSVEQFDTSRRTVNKFEKQPLPKGTKALVMEWVCDMGHGISVRHTMRDVQALDSTERDAWMAAWEFVFVPVESPKAHIALLDFVTTPVVRMGRKTFDAIPTLCEPCADPQTIQEATPVVVEISFAEVARDARGGESLAVVLDATIPIIEETGQRVAAVNMRWPAGCPYEPCSSSSNTASRLVVLQVGSGCWVVRISTEVSVATFSLDDSGWVTATGVEARAR